MNFWGLILATLLLLSAGSASAFVTDLEQNIRVGETAYELSFNVSNNSNIRQPLSVSYDIPSEVQVINQPNYVRANSEEKIIVKILPGFVLAAVLIRIYFVLSSFLTFGRLNVLGVVSKKLFLFNIIMKILWKTIMFVAIAKTRR